MIARIALAVALLGLGAPRAVEARIVRLTIDRVEPFAGGMEFAPTGSYVRLAGTAAGELDPSHPVNAGIVNLDRAPRNARGLVEYEVDFYLMRPTELTRGNRKILYEVVNRGRKFLLHWLHEAPATSPGAVNDPATAAHAGNGFALREGYTLVWSGWEPEVARSSGALGARLPVATADGVPIIKTIRDEFVFGTRVPGGRATAPLSHEAATPQPGWGRLAVRARESDPATEIPASGWAFGDARSIKLLPEGTAFRPGLIYDFWYPAKNPRVLGIGYAATRDLVAFLRYETADTQGTPNPLALSAGATGIRAALAIGISQSGRYLRDHIHQGFNQDENRRRVFDGVLAHAAGAGRVFANVEFGQPARTSTQHEDHHFPEAAFPFAHGLSSDPVTGRTGALLRGDGFDPLVIEVNTSTEYWQKGASLLHTDPLGARDVDVPGSVRLYLIAGTQHGGRAGLLPTAGNCLLPRNPHNPAPALRALVVALDRWATAGLEPPVTRVPTLGAGTLAPAERLEFPAVPGMRVPRAGNHLVPFGDWVNPQHVPGQAYVTLVPRVAGDGNEVAGVRLPGVAAPLGTYTGWNVYRAPYPEGELCDREGSFIPFARTRAEREAAGDPRPSLEERYGNQEGYLRRVTEVVRDLLRARFLLPDDAARYVDEAARRDPFKP